MSKPEPPVCPRCGCTHAPVKESRALKGAVISKHMCRNCGKTFSRKLSLLDAKLCGIPNVDLKGGA